MKPGGTSEQIARSTRRCTSASSVPLSTVSYSSMRVSGRSLRKQLEAAQQQPGRKHDLDRELQLALPTRRQVAAGPLERLGLLAAARVARRYSTSPLPVSRALRPLISNSFTCSSASIFCTA